jgi:mono/diheme cytochrome c family protein
MPAMVGGVLLCAPCSLAAQDTTRGKAVYEKWCASCHGDGGAGDGPAARYMLPRPRDFTAALYQIRTTASGQLPTDADLMAVMAKGIPGTTMPGWETRLSKQDRAALLAQLKSFSAFFADSSLQPQALEFGRAPGGGEAAVRMGRQFYDSIGCAKCHGERGRGDGPSAATLEDDAGLPILAADLSQHWLFNGGGSVEDIYRRLRTGLDGTPMPSFSDLIEQQFLTDEELWRLAQYVRSLSPERAPEPAEVIRAPQRAGPLPAAPDDSGWADLERYWVPLAGQIIRKPRWFTPAVRGIWVQAVHDGATLALRLTWHDRSASPDTAWQEFAGKVLAAVAGDDSVTPAPGPWPDQVAVQFPRRLADGMERPYFLMGSGTDPVYQWRWSSAPAGTVAGLVRGLERFDPLPGARVAAQATYDRGEWRVVFTRALATADTANELVFRTGRAIPIALFAWDGSLGEAGARSAVSSWYSLALERPTPPTVYLSPVIAMALTLGLGLVVVRRAQRRTTGEGGREKGEG